VLRSIERSEPTGFDRVCSILVLDVRLRNMDFSETLSKLHHGRLYSNIQIEFREKLRFRKISRVATKRIHPWNAQFDAPV
jgi:hypothetical protein